MNEVKVARNEVVVGDTMWDADGVAWNVTGVESTAKMTRIHWTIKLSVGHPSIEQPRWTKWRKSDRVTSVGR